MKKRNRKHPRVPTYEGGIHAVLDQMEARRDPLTFAEGEALPSLDVDLAALRDKKILRPAEDPHFQLSSSSYSRKCKSLRREFRNQSELCCLNAILIANLRRRSQPKDCAALFIRLWREHSDFLVKNLDLRWLVSSITTFGDHGDNETQRLVGNSLTVLFGTMKLYETERRYSGSDSDTPFTFRGRSKDPLPLDMDPFSINNGGLDVNMLGRIWQDADADPVIAPLAHHLINELIHDPRNVFRRLRTMRHRTEKKAANRPLSEDEKRKGKVTVHPARRVETDPARLKWGLVATVMAPAAQIAQFAAHHLELGAERIYLYLDEPNPEASALLSSHPAITTTVCNGAYWAAQERPRPDAHQMRQAYNATQVYRDCHLDWLGHIDVDEFLLPNRPVAEQLAEVPETDLCARVLPAELLFSDNPAEQNRHFKLGHRDANQTRAVFEDIYPNFGAHLKGGFISHTLGKTFTRTGVDHLRIGIHFAKLNANEVGNRVVLEDVRLGHDHAASFETFRDRLQFRMERGSYRSKDPEKLKLQDILKFLLETEGEAGLRQFYSEICEATPELLERLRLHGKLLTYPLDYSAVDRVFPTMQHRAAGE